MTDVRVLETRSVRSPLGLRLLDPTDDRPVRGLSVTARPLDVPRGVTAGIESRSGTYGFHAIAGIPPLLDRADAPPRQVAIRVVDPARRYVPAVYLVDAPARRPPALPTDGRGLYVFPSVTHPGRPGAVVVRTWIAHATTGDPAAHAVVELETDGQEAFGVADADGAACVVLPLPVVDAASDGVRASWPLTVRVRWAPDDHQRVAELPTPTTMSLFTQALAIVQDLPTDLVVRESTSLVVSSTTADAEDRLLVRPPT